MVVSQGDIHWAELGAPVGSGPGFNRPVIVVQGDALNRTTIATVVCVPLTSTVHHSTALGNVLLQARRTGLFRDSVANVSQILTIDRSQLGDRVGRLSDRELDQLFAGIDIVLGR